MLKSSRAPAKLGDASAEADVAPVVRIRRADRSTATPSGDPGEFNAHGVDVAHESEGTDSGPASLNVLVLGMHRSGTSAVAQALMAAGLDAGDQAGLMDPEPQNPMGFGERLDIALFNDRLLASLEWYWDAPDPEPLANPPARPSFVAEGRALVESNLAGPRPFMLKDPRISLLLPWWRQILFDRFVPVVVLRDPAEVAWSLSVRDGFPIELGLALWAAYHRHLAAGLDGMEWIAVDYAALCEKPKGAVSHLLKSLAALGVEAEVDSRAGARTIRPLLRRATQPRELGADSEAIAAIAKLRAQWPDEAVATASRVEPSPTPSEWEKAILRVHRRTREAKAREEAARARVAALESRAASLATQHAEVEHVAGQLREDASSLRRQLESASRERDAARGKLVELDARVAALSEQHVELERVAAQLRSESAAFRQQVENVSRERDVAVTSLGELKTRLETARQDGSEISMRLQALGAEHAELQRGTAALQQEAADAARERDFTKDRLADVSRDGDAARASLAEVERRLATQRAANAVLRQQLKNLGGERDAARASLTEVEDRVAMLVEASIEHEATAASLAENIEELEREATVLRADGATLRILADSLVVERDAAQANITELARVAVDSRADAAGLRNQLEHGQRERDQLAGERDELRRQREELLQHAASSDDRLRRSEEELDSLRTTIGRLEVQLAATATSEATRTRVGLSRDSIGSLVRASRRAYRRAITRLPQTLLGLAWHNPLFDPSWYLQQYPDVRDSTTGPELHFRRHGVHEGRKPNPLFDTSWYLARYPDVSRGGLNPLDHYLSYGAAELRDPSSDFNTAWYLATNLDVARSGLNPLLHYLRFGMFEGRQPIRIAEARSASAPVTPRAIPQHVAPSQSAPHPAIEEDVRLIAFYRAEYYAHSQSRTGGDFACAEWLTVARARPTFTGHRQPRVPGELGFYDLRLPEVRHEQSELARSHGIHAFCYHEAWGHPALHTLPFREMLASGEPDFPFALCLTLDPSPAAKPAVSVLTIAWLKANLLQVTSALQALQDKRAVTVASHPVLLVEGLGGSHGRRVSDFLRQESVRNGLPGLFLVALVREPRAGAARALGVDAVLSSHPNRRLFPENGALSGNERSPQPTVMSYDDYLRKSRLITPSPDRLPTVLSGWDDTPLRGHDGLVLSDATPESYGEWLRSEVASARDVFPRERRFVFVASWNDWARGGYLEPDILNGRAYLERTIHSIASTPRSAAEQTQ